LIPQFQVLIMMKEPKSGRRLQSNSGKKFYPLIKSIYQKFQQKNSIILKIRRYKENSKKLIEPFDVLKANEKIRHLARAYIEHGVFPEKYIDDALHVAIASFNQISYIISWNFEHLVKVKTRRVVNSVNILEGFGEIEIVSPQEL